jgi:hypothetical protein
MRSPQERTVAISFRAIGVTRVATYPTATAARSSPEVSPTGRE